jgi:DNA topoisomerase I
MTIVQRLQANGIRRLSSSGNGFRYRRSEGGRVSAEDLARIRALVLPPGWTDVWISASPASAVQAIGKDRAGRWQYRYSEKQTRIREKRKRRRLLALLAALPAVRGRVARDLRGQDLSRERVLAAMVQLLLRGFLRPGSEAYARDNGTYGLATLRSRHVAVRGRRITLTYPGKGKKLQTREIEDAAVARVIAALLRVPGYRVFRCPGSNGAWTNVRRRHVNDYIREIAGARFSAKDFRTWAGTLLGGCALARLGFPEPVSAAALRRRVREAMRETSSLLGNTPAVCRASYVCPSVIAAFEKGRLLPRPPALEKLVRGSPGLLATTERRLARLIREESGLS